MLLVVVVWFAVAPLFAQTQYSTANFIVTAETPKLAKQSAEVAEKSRKELAILWLGEELPAWETKCPVEVRAGLLGDGGYTEFAFVNGVPGKWKMVVQGTRERVLDSVIPHEVNHTVFATHFGHPLPRWADEGAASLVESEIEQRRTIQYLPEQRLPMNALLERMEYPQDKKQVFALYAEGFSLTAFFVREESHASFVRLLEEAPEYGWSEAIRRNSKFDGIEDLEQAWRK